jgi:predicted permease
MKSLAARSAEAYPEHDAQTSLRLAPLHESIGDVASRRFAWLMLVLTGFVLLIACVNLANLQLTRAASRSREFAVRLALGVGQWRLMRQLMVESLLLAVLGGLVGIGLAIWTSDFIGAHLTRWSPRGMTIILDGHVLFFALLCSAATGVLFGVIPAWLASRTNMNDTLKSATRGTTAGKSQHRLRHSLIVGEVALALILLTGAGLFITGLQALSQQDPGWRVDGLWIGWLPQTSAKYTSPDQRRAFVQRLEERLSTVPGVQKIGISSSLPLWSFGTSRPFIIEGRPPPPLGQEPFLFAEAITPGYFDTLGIRLRHGRFFSSVDTTNQPDVVIINEAMARRFWPHEDPVGKRIGNADRSNPGWQRIVGVVSDIRFPANLGRAETQWQMYRPMAQEPRPYVAIEVRAAGSGMAAALRLAVAELDPDLPINELEVARTTVQRFLGHFTLAGAFLALFAALGLVLAALGIYGVISYFVLQRTGEIGIRMALGAQRSQVLWLVLRKGFVLSGVGALIGLFGAVGVASLLAAAVPELPTFNLLTLIGVVLVLLVAVLFACWLPARRATRMDPIVALRYE